jgi:hypothetical protein
MRPSYSWVIPIAGFWPLVAFGVTFLRFGELPGDGEQVAAAVLGFLLVGVLSGLVLISLLRRTASRSTSAFVVGGYVLAAPFDYVLGIVGPLSLEAFGAGWPPRSMDYLLLFSSYGRLLRIFAARVRSGDRLPDRLHYRSRVLKAFPTSLG